MRRGNRAQDEGASKVAGRQCGATERAALSSAARQLPHARLRKAGRVPTAAVFLREDSIPPEESLRFPRLAFRDGIVFRVESSLKCWREGRRNDDDPSNQCAGMCSVIYAVLVLGVGFGRLGENTAQECVEEKTTRKTPRTMTNRTCRPREGFVMIRGRPMWQLGRSHHAAAPLPA